MEKNIDISIVVPCFRGESTLDELCSRLVAVLSSTSPGFEIILVDDSDRNELWSVISRLADRYSQVSGLRLSRNFGQHNATVAGLRRAKGSMIVSLDEDLQNPPEEIPRLIQAMRENSLDVVYGIPQRRRGPVWRALASSLIMIIPRVVMDLDFDISAFRLIRGPIAKRIAESERHDIVLDIYISWLTRRIGAVEVEHFDSNLKSSYSLTKLVSLLIDLICNYTVFPLRVIAVAGTAISLVSLAAAAFILLAKIQNFIDVPGWASTIVSIFVGVGLILLALGIVSEYLARIFLHINTKPQSYVRSTTDDA